MVMKKKKTIPKKKVVKSLPKKTTKVPTHIPNFDNLIGGGFINESTNLIIGNSGNGKTIFAMQFLIGGMKKGEKALYVTFEEKKEQFYKNMKIFGWDLESYEKKGLFTFLEYTPLKVKTMLEEGGGTIESIILKEKISRLVIDSITSFELLFEKELEKREATLDLINMLKKWACTVLLTLESDASNKRMLGTRAVEFESDSIILLYFLKQKNIRKRYLEILKMRGTNHSKNTYGFTIGKSGISIQKKASSLKNK